MLTLVRKADISAEFQDSFWSGRKDFAFYWLVLAQLMTGYGNRTIYSSRPMDKDGYIFIFLCLL